MKETATYIWKDNVKIKWILKKKGLCGLDSSGLEQGPAAALVNSDEPSCSITCGEFLDWGIIIQGLLHGFISLSQLTNQVN
jgi:hypothetical protein